MKNKLCLLTAALALATLPAFAQGGNSEVSANFTGNFQKQASGLALTDDANYSGGLLLNYRYHFNRWSAVEANFSYTRFTQSYSSGSQTQANAREATFAYQFNFGVASDARLRPFVEA